MKKFLILACAAAMMMSGCNKDDVKDVFTESIATFNLLTDEQGNASVSTGSYSFNFDRLNGYVVVSTSDLSLSSVNKVGFTTSNIPYSAWMVSGNNANYSLAHFESAEPCKDVEDLSCTLTTGVFQPSEIVEGYGVTRPASMLGYYPVMSYQYGDTEVRTFWPDMTFKGTTKTTIRGTNPFETPDIEYRIVMNLKDAPNYTADVFLLKARFAQGMGVMLNIALRNLPLKFDKDGFTIEAPADFSPETIGDGGFLTNDKYKFDSFKVVSSRNLTAVDISYRVMGMFEGSFSGNNVVIPSEGNQD